MGGLSGQVAIVTGGGRGIGRTVAQMLAAQGAAVAVLGRQLQPLEETAAAIEQAGGIALALSCDMVDRDTVAAAVDQCSRELGAVSLLVNNAGVAGGGPLWQMDPDQWWHIQEVNVKGPFLAMHTVLPGMLERGAGRIINMGSFAANSTGPGGSAYSTSKAALQRLTEGAAADLEGTGISVFAISPGFVWTDMGRDYDQALRANAPDYQGMDPAWVFPPEAAGELCLKLASGEADCLSGRFIHVREDLAALVADIDQIREADLHVLRLTGPGG